MLYPEARDAAGQDTVAWIRLLGSADLAAARRAVAETASMRPRDEMAEVLDLSADGVACRAYMPTRRAEGVVLFVPAGGFVLHDIEVYDVEARRLARLAGRTVLIAALGNAPERPFPAALEDLDTVLRWLTEPGPVPTTALTGPVAAVGVGSGGGIAVAAVLRNKGLLTALALVCPMIEPTDRFDSRRTETAAVDDEGLAWSWWQYVDGDEDLFDHPEVAPLHSVELWTLPPTCVITAEHDPCRSEGEHLARVLAEQGVRVVASRYLGQVHDFVRHPPLFTAALPALGQAATFVTEHLGG